VPMKDPPHPGLSLQQNCIEPDGLDIVDASSRLGVTTRTLSLVVHGHAALSADLAIRLENAGWSTAEFWMHRQAAYDLGKHACTKTTPQPRQSAAELGRGR